MFIENYKYANHPGSIQIEHLISYIKEREHELQDWYVIIEAKKGSTTSILNFDDTHFVGRKTVNKDDYILTNENASVMGPKVIYNSLPNHIQSEVDDITQKNNNRLSFLTIVNCFKMPILVLTPIKSSTDIGQNLITYSILMPNSDIEEPFKEVLVNADVAYFNNEYYDDDEEEDQDD